MSRVGAPPRPLLPLALASLALAGACAPRDGGPTAGGRGSAGGGAPGEAADEPIPIPEALLADLVRDTERVRGLRALEPVRGLSVSDAQLWEHISETIEGQDLRVAELILRAFGFLPDGSGDLAELLVRLLGQEVIGLYDPPSDRLMVRAQVAASLGSNSPEALESRAVLVHEVVHALQDQHFETLAAVGDDVWADDAASALDCLAEGDATLAMIVYSLEAAGMDPSVTTSPAFGRLIRGLGQMALPSSPALAEAPPYFGFVLGATYFEGAAFAAEMRRRGGWAAVDEAHRSPPAGTFHVLHPELYVEGRRPVVVTLPQTIPGLEEPGFHIVRSAVLGELETAAFLLPVGDAELAAEGAAGWAGDRFTVFEGESGALALVFRVRFVSAAEAAQFAVVARDATVGAGRGPCEERSPESSTDLAWSCHGGEDAIVQAAEDVVVVRGAPAARVVSIVLAALSAPVEEPAPEAEPAGAPALEEAEEPVQPSAPAPATD